MLVKANIHGSMNGKPNKGPKGIISLDGGGVEYFKDDKPVSFGDQAGVTIDVSTQEGQDKRQDFRDKTVLNYKSKLFFRTFVFICSKQIVYA